MEKMIMSMSKTGELFPPSKKPSFWIPKMDHPLDKLNPPNIASTFS
jgi:hypothetical protein